MAASLCLARSAATAPLCKSSATKPRVNVVCKAADNHMLRFLPFAPAAEHAEYEEHAGPIEYNLCQESARNSLDSVDYWFPETEDSSPSTPTPAAQEEGSSFLNCWPRDDAFPVCMDAETSRLSLDSMDIWMTGDE